MKKIILTIAIVLVSISMYAQPTPPGGGYQHGGGGNQPAGGGAPLDGGFSIMLVLGAFYGAKKVFQVKKKEEE